MTPSYPKRTEQNIMDSDGTLIISHGKLTGGSALTRKLAKKHGKPWVHIDLASLAVSDAVRFIRSWLERNDIQTLNIAGPRQSKAPGIYELTREVLKTALHYEGQLYGLLVMADLFVSDEQSAYGNN